MKKPQAVRHDITTLRGVAILGIFIYHLDFVLGNNGWLPGGFTGVEVFLAVSGYLITRIMLTELLEGRLTLMGFYARRLQRLCPALLITVLAVMGLELLLSEPEELKRHALEGILALGFVSNFYHAFVTFYFANTALDMPFLHTWFLSVLVQIYLVYPVLLLLCVRVFGVQREQLGALLLSLTALALLGSVLYATRDPRFAYYMPYSRCYAFLAGAWACCQPLRVCRARTAEVLGLTLIVLGMVLTGEAEYWPAPAALLPVCGTCLCLAAGSGDSIFSHLAFRWVGTISYPLYLAHWPLMVLAARLGMDDWQWGVAAIALWLAVMLHHGAAWRSYRGLTAAAATAVLILACLSIILTDGLPQRLRKGLPEAARYGGYGVPDDGRLHFINEHYHQDVDFILTGDSFARQYTRALEARGFVVATVLDDGCYSSADFINLRPEGQIYPSCDLRHRNFLTAAAQYPGRDVVIAHDWQRYEHRLLRRSTLTAPAQLSHRDILAHDLRQLSAQLVERRIFIVLSHYQSRYNLGAACLTLRSLDNPLAQALSHSGVCAGEREMREQTLNAFLRQEAARLSNVTVIDPNALLCTGRRCRVMLEDSGLPVYSDGLHYSVAGADAALQGMLPAMGYAAAPVPPQPPDARPGAAGYAPAGRSRPGYNLQE